MCLSVFSTKEFESTERGGQAPARSQEFLSSGIRPLCQHRHPFSAGSLNFDAAPKLMDFADDRLDLVSHQARNDHSTLWFHGQPKSWCRFLEQFAVEVCGYQIEAAFWCVL